MVASREREVEAGGDGFFLLAEIFLGGNFLGTGA